MIFCCQVRGIRAADPRISEELMMQVRQLTGYECLIKEDLTSRSLYCGRYVFGMLKLKTGASSVV